VGRHHGVSEVLMELGLFALLLVINLKKFVIIELIDLLFEELSLNLRLKSLSLVLMYL
jgi:hypothetical protein